MIRFLTLFLFSLLVSRSVVAQTYQRLIQPDKYWEIMTCDRTLICNYTWGARYHFEGDTVINGQTYAKMYGQALISPWGTTPYCGPFAVSPDRFLSDMFIREDTLAQRIYHYSTLNNEPEFLLFDLTMVAGDTLFSNFWGYCVLDSITATDLNDGVVRRVYHFDNAKFIEGIGTVNALNDGGPFYPPTIHIAHCDQLYCFEHIGYTQGGCSGPLSTDDQTMGNALAPHPNPASDLIRIPSVGNGPAQVFIHDQLGRLVLRHDLPMENANVDIRGLRPGTYSYRAVASEGSAMTGRFEVLR